MADLSSLVIAAQQGVESEVNLVKSQYAFKGYGRSTELAQKASDAQSKAQEVYTAAVNYKAAQDLFDSLVGSDDKGAIFAASKMVANASNEYESKRSSQLQRLSAISDNLLGYSQAQDQLRSREQQISGFKKKKVYKKTFTLQKSSADLNKKEMLSHIKSAGEIASLKGINKLMTLSTLPTLMSLQSLSAI